MDVLSDELLIEALIRAEKLELADDFIAVLRDEIEARGIKKFKDFINPSQLNNCNNIEHYHRNTFCE